MKRWSWAIQSYLWVLLKFYQPVPYAFLNSVPKYQEEFEDNASFKLYQEAWQEIHERSKENVQSCLSLKLLII